MFYVILALLVVVFIVLFIFYHVRKKWAIRKVKQESEEKKLKEVNAALEPFGFAFDLEQDIVISKNDSWQRDMGYQDLFDLKAPFLNMVMDAEPIYFVYKGHEYRLEFWKGQYGITTGAEIGFYVRDLHCKEDHFQAVSDEERLEMGFKLYKNCFLFSRSGLSWWLTGFDVGNFSKPRNLKMKCCVRFRSRGMQIAFVEGLLQAGYNKCQIHVCCDCVCFDFCCAHNYKVNGKYCIIKCIAQFCNYINVSFFNFFTRYFNRTIDKLTYIRYMAPCLYRFIIRLSIPRRKQKKHCKQRKIHKNKERL